MIVFWVLWLEAVRCQLIHEILVNYISKTSLQLESEPNQHALPGRSEDTDGTVSPLVEASVFE